MSDEWMRRESTNLSLARDASQTGSLRFAHPSTVCERLEVMADHHLPRCGEPTVIAFIHVMRDWHRAWLVKLQGQPGLNHCTFIPFATSVIAR
jgi:hypothetical protein